MSTDDYDDPGYYNFRAAAGSAAAQAADDTAKANRGGKFDRPGYFKLGKDRETATLRFVSEFEDLESDWGRKVAPWTTLLVHPFVPTKSEPMNYRGNKWPAERTAICRTDQVFRDRFPGGCPIDEMTYTTGFRKGKKCNPTLHTFALAVLREEVVGTQEMVSAGQCQPSEVGMRLGLRDRMKEVTVVGPDGKATDEKKIVADLVIVEQGWENFFGPISSLASMYGTVLDRDYRIVRYREDKDTTYRTAPMDPLPFTMPDGSTRTYDLRDPEIMALKFPNGVFDLWRSLAELTSERYLRRYFIGPQDDDGKSDDGQGTPQPASRPAPPVADVASSAALAGMRDRIMNYPGAAAAGPSTAAAPAATAVPSGQRAF